jgi:hypothetical protein
MWGDLISKRCAAFENVDDNADIKRTWEVLGRK